MDSQAAILALDALLISVGDLMRFEGEVDRESAFGFHAIRMTSRGMYDRCATLSPWQRFYIRHYCIPLIR